MDKKYSSRELGRRRPAAPWFLVSVEEVQVRWTDEASLPVADLLAVEAWDASPGAGPFLGLLRAPPILARLLSYLVLAT